MAFTDGSRTKGGKAYRQHQSLKEYIRRRENHTCQLCGQPGDIVDHIIPYALCHDSTLANLRVLCHKCNLITRRKRKSHTIPSSQWYDYLESELAILV